MKTIAIAFLLLWLSSFAAAQIGGTGTIGPTFNRHFPFVGGMGSGGGTPVTCSNSLDFSDGCNSQYLSLFKGMI